MRVGHGDGLALQPLLELRIAPGDGDMANGIPQGTFLTNDNADFLGTGDGGVDEVALEHYVVCEVDGDDDDGIFATALRSIQEARVDLPTVKTKEKNLCGTFF